MKAPGTLELSPPTGCVGNHSEAPAAWTYNAGATLSRYSPWAGSTSKQRTKKAWQSHEGETWLPSPISASSLFTSTKAETSGEIQTSHEKAFLNWVGGQTLEQVSLERWSMPPAFQCFRGIWTMPLARCFNLVLSELFRELVSHYLQEKMLSPDSSYHSRADLPAQKWLSTA